MLRRVWPRVTRLALPWLLGLAVASSSGAALADGPSAQDRTTARQLAVEGYDALQRRDYALAADRFKRADALVHAPTLLVDLGRSYIGLGRLVEAYEAFQQVLREGVSADAPQPWHQALVRARTEATALEPRLAWLTIHVEGPDTPRVTLDGHELPLASLDTKRAVDPGQRNLLIEAEGFLPAESSLDLDEGETEEVHLELQPDPNYVPPSSALADQPELATRPLPQGEASSGQRTLAYVAYGVGGAGLLLGGVSTAVMLTARSDLEGVCKDGECPETSASDLSKYHTYGTLAAVGFGMALAGAGVGTYLLMSEKSENEGESPLSVSVQLAPGYASIKGRF
jgi:hypothetical protein